MFNHFKTEQSKKRGEFHEEVHATFILNTSLTRFGILTKEQKSWLSHAYPGTTLETGTDQGASYYTITPNF